jgi:hypothetical protein
MRKKLVIKSGKYKIFGVSNTNDKEKTIKLYREGKPRITECLNQHKNKRSSGLYGCGIYAYLSENIAKKRCIQSKSDCYEIDVSEFKIYIPNNLDNLIDLSNAMNNILFDRVVIAFGISIDNKESLDDALFNINRSETIKFTKDEINKAIDGSKECKGSLPLEECSPPINYLLHSKGFDGIIPKGKSADENQFGCVIFKEAIERKLQRKFKSFEDIDIGVKLDIQ